MTWETDKVWEYIQNNESFLEELSNQTDDDIHVSLRKSNEFRQYVFELFMENVDFEELENELKDNNYSVELEYLDYCFPHELNSEDFVYSEAILSTVIIGVDCGFAVYDDTDLEKQFNLQEEILSKLYCIDLKDKEMDKAIKHYADNELSDDVDWLYDEIKNKITDGKKLYLEVVITKE